MCKYGNEWVAGLIAKAQDGGIALGIANPSQKNPQAQVTADVVVLQVTIPLSGPPGHPQPFIAKLDIQNRAKEIIDAATNLRN